jgi:hypothetical protein
LASSIAFAFALATLAWTFFRTSSSDFFIDNGGVSDDDDDDDDDEEDEDEEESEDVVITARVLCLFVRLVKALVLRIPKGRLFPSLLHLSRNAIATCKDWTKEALICVYISSLAARIAKKPKKREKAERRNPHESVARFSLFFSLFLSQRSTESASFTSCFIWRDFSHFVCLFPEELFIFGHFWRVLIASEEEAER